MPLVAAAPRLKWALTIPCLPGPGAARSDIRRFKKPCPRSHPPPPPRRLALAAATFALPAAAQVTVADAWVRGTVTGQSATGAFMQLKSPADTALVAAASPVAKIVEIHEMKMDAGVMKMSAVDALAVARRQNRRTEARRLPRDADGTRSRR